MKWVSVLFVGLIQGAIAADYRFEVVTRDGVVVPNAVVSAGDAGSAVLNPAVMDQIDKAFAPYVLAVDVGTSVTFPNSDQIRHHVYSFSKAKPFELRLYSGTPESPIVFDEPGVVVLGCNIHDNMVGYIYVSERPLHVVTDKAGKAQFSTDKPVTEVSVWYPSLSINAQSEQTFTLADLSREGDVYRVVLEIAPPPEFPQAIRTTDRTRFRRYIER